jgi:hypothetical protein
MVVQGQDMVVQGQDMVVPSTTMIVHDVSRDSDDSQIMGTWKIMYIMSDKETG